MKQNEPLFAEEGVVVTEANFLVRGQTFSLSQVVTAHVEEKGLSRGLWVVVVAVAGFVALGLSESIGGGVALGLFLLSMAAMAVYAEWYKENRANYRLFLHTSAGAVLNPFTTKDSGLAYRVKDALDLAIAVGVPAVPEEQEPEAPGASRRRVGLRNMVIGGVVFLIGTAITVGSADAEEGPAVVFYGAVIFGGLQFVRGLWQFLRG